MALRIIYPMNRHFFDFKKKQASHSQYFYIKSPAKNSLLFKNFLGRFLRKNLKAGLGISHIQRHQRVDDQSENSSEKISDPRLMNGNNRPGNTAGTNNKIISLA